MDMDEIKKLLSNLTDEQAMELREEMIEHSCNEATTHIRQALQSQLLNLTMRYPERMFFFNGKFVASEPIAQEEKT